jgi:ATP-dependent exoDNAse (exonuclease V) beta subunit
MLLISGTVSVYKSGGIGTYGWLDRLDESLGLSDQAPLCDGEGNAVHSFDLDVGHQPVRCIIYEPDAQLASVSVAPQFEPPSPALPHQALLEPVSVARRPVNELVGEADRDPPRRVWQVVSQAEQPWAPSWVVGKLVHLALEHWIFPQDRRVDFHAWAGSQARSSGLTERDIVRDAVQRAARILTRFRASPLYAEMTGAERRLHEVPYSGLDNEGEPDSGVIDALFRSEQRWVLVEFKTDRVEDRATLEATLVENDYVRQVAHYLDAAERLLGQRPRPVLCFLNYRGHVHLVEDRW